MEKEIAVENQKLGGEEILGRGGEEEEVEVENVVTGGGKSELVREGGRGDSFCAVEGRRGVILRENLSPEMKNQRWR